MNLNFNTLFLHKFPLSDFAPEHLSLCAVKLLIIQQEWNNQIFKVCISNCRHKKVDDYFLWLCHVPLQHFVGQRDCTDDTTEQRIMAQKKL